MKIVRTTSQHSALGEFFWYQRFPWFRLSIRVLAGLVGLVDFASSETMLQALGQFGIPVWQLST